VFHTWESYNAVSFKEDGALGQGLVAQWIHAGGTAGVGNVWEPTISTNTVTNEDVLFPMLLNGYTFAEAAWSSNRQLSWVNTVVGDPLMTFEVFGDFNGDRVVNTMDISGFKAALADKEAWEQLIGRDADIIGDFDCDTNFVSLDIPGFKLFMSSGQVTAFAVPEPATLSLLGLISMGVFHKRPRRR
jgi:hypothetical protein